MKGKGEGVVSGIESTSALVSFRVRDAPPQLCV